jgi:hypothetical protein
MAYVANTSVPVIAPRYTMFGAQRPPIQELIGHLGLSWQLKRLFLEESIKDQRFIALVRSALEAPLGKSPELDALHSRFGVGEHPESYCISHFIKGHGLIKSLEHPVIRELFSKYAPGELLEDSRMRFVLDNRSPLSILNDPQMKEPADIFWHFISTKFDVNRFISVPGNQSIYKETNHKARMKYYNNLINTLRSLASK